LHFKNLNCEEELFSFVLTRYIDAVEVFAWNFQQSLFDSLRVSFLDVRFSAMMQKFFERIENRKISVSC